MYTSSVQINIMYTNNVYICSNNVHNMYTFKLICIFETGYTGNPRHTKCIHFVYIITNMYTFSVQINIMYTNNVYIF
jgi:hypothetical protein